MVMENKGRIDVVSRPSIMLPPGYQKSEDVGAAVSQAVASQDALNEEAITASNGAFLEETQNLTKHKLIISDERISANGGKLNDIAGSNSSLKSSESKSTVNPSEVYDVGSYPPYMKSEQDLQEEERMKSLFEKFNADKSDSVGWVQKNEVKIAKKKIREVLGFDPPPMAGFWMAVAIHEEKHAVTRDGKKSFLISADADEDKFRRPTGLVVSQGPWCYKGEHFKEPIFWRICRFFFGRWMEPSMYRPWCRVGDCVVIPRHEGQMVNYRGIPLLMIRDTKIYSPIEDPSFITREF